MVKPPETVSRPAAAKPLEDLSGVVDHIVYRAEETGYTVCALKPDKRTENVIVVGNCAAIWPGETLNAQGRWTRHKAHGYQFNAEKMVCQAPSSTTGIKKYLAGGMIKGIGKVLAERLVAKFGEDTLRIIEQESARLESVEGVGKKRREQIKTAWNEQKAVREIMLFLHAHGVGPAQAVRIHRTYGDKAIAVVRENPYRLAADVWGIGFKSADKIALNLGVPLHSVLRAKAGLVYTLQGLTDEGHCFCPREELIGLAEQLLTIPRSILDEALELELREQSLIQERQAVYLSALYYAEVGIASQIRRLQVKSGGALALDADKAIGWAAGRIKITFAPGQVDALKMALSQKVAIITGGPGVGKTTIIRALVDIFAAKSLRVCLAAPTGRAAKRMEEATGRPAMTIHRLLKFRPGTGGFEHGQDYPLAGDVFILDEVSMIDVPLMNAFLRAVPPCAALVMVGDADQLPSVGPGNVLRDLVNSGVVPSVKLDKIFRQSERSWIVHNAHLVNRGKFLELPPAKAISDFYFIEENEPDQVIRLAVDLITRRIPQRFGFDPRTEIQLLTPMRRFQLGSENMNAVLQAAINPTGAALVRFGRTYRVGDRIMQLRNNYDKDVFNGDIGVIREVDQEEQEVRADFDGQSVVYELSELDEIGLAYACSIHKSQGHEHPAVVLLLTTQHFNLLQRNLLYTAITRGRRLVCLIGSKRAVQIAIHNNRTIERRTALKARLVAAGGSLAQVNQA